MATTNKFVRQIQNEDAEDLRLLTELSRILDASLAEPRKITVKEHPKYVTGTTRQGDEAFASELRKHDAVRMFRAFGRGMDMNGVARGIRLEIEASLGKGKDLSEYVDVTTQAICQILMSYADVTSDSASAASANLKAIRTSLVTAAKDATNTFEDALEAADSSGVLQGKVNEYLYPLNRNYIQMVELKVMPMLNDRQGMMDYIANASAQRAVTRYLTKKAPSSDVLVPAAIGATTSLAVEAAFGKNPQASVEATFKYYQEAVKAEIDLGVGIRVGEVKGSLEAAKVAIRSAISNLARTGADTTVQNEVKSKLQEIERLVARISPSKAEAKYELERAMADLIALVNGANDLGELTATFVRDKLDGLFVSRSDTSVRDAVLNELQKPRYRPSTSAIAERSIEYMDFIDDICPRNVRSRSVTDLFLDPVRNEISAALLSLKNAYSELVVVSSATVPAQPYREPEITDEFKDLANGQIQSTLGMILTEVTSASTNVDLNAVNKALVEVMRQALGVQTATISGTTIPLVNPLTTPVANWDMPWEAYSALAQGDVISLKDKNLGGLSLENSLVDIINQAASGASSRVRRATRDIVIRNVAFFLDALKSISIQASSMGMVIRRNPAGGFEADTWWKKGLVGTGALLSDHATASLINRFAKPDAGSIGAYASDYGTSLATALWGTSYVTGMKVPVLNSDARKNEALGYSMIGGALAHASLRFIFKNNIGNARFSENPVLKALQYPTNGVAKALGDMSMGVSACCPANIQDHKSDSAAYVLELVRVNPKSALVGIACQLWESGANMSVAGTELTITVGNKKTADDLKNKAKDPSLKKTLGAIATLKCMIECGCEPKVKDANSKNILVCAKADKLKGDKVEASKKSIYAEFKKVCGLSKDDAETFDDLSAFILEPGYNMNVYSGEDHVQYFQPAPIKTAQSGIAQLDAAIARAKRLSPSEKASEGIGDMHHIEVVLATPSTCRMAEDAGVGMSLGRSRKNPQTELLALEVEGDNGLLDVHPARQYGVPQGSLENAKIRHAQNIDVTPNGLFNRGAFGPLYGK